MRQCKAAALHRLELQGNSKRICYLTENSLVCKCAFYYWKYLDFIR